jgi:hypothetical protein
MEENKSFSEVYLETEQLLIDRLYQTIKDTIQEKKKIQILDPADSSKEENLEYFFITDTAITFNSRTAVTTKCAVTTKALKDAIKYALRTDEEITRKSFNKMYGTSNIVGAPHYLLISLIKDEIIKHRVVGLEVSHVQFGLGLISRMELQKNYLWFKFNEELKKISMDYFSLKTEDQQKINAKIACV